jgi:nicotinamide-nucleotide amidase
MIAQLEAQARDRLGNFVYGIDEETLEIVVVRMLIERNLKLATAESCTGGLIAHRITNVPGSSEAFLAGIVAYSNEAKSKFLGVASELIQQYGAVSPEVAEAMAVGAQERTRADITVGVTGIAGPGGGTPEKPVGLVYIAIKTPDGTSVTRNIMGGGRAEIKLRSSQTALNMIRSWILSQARVPG